jgi:GT2 family glycosyltransferase
MTTPAISVVIPNWNGRQWLPGCLAALDAQTLAASEVIIVDNGSRDGSLTYLHEEHPLTRVLLLGRNTGFAHAANRGIDVASGEFVALLNTDVLIAADWLERMSRALVAAPGAAAAACKILDLANASLIYDAGDYLRRDGASEQRGRFTIDDGRFDAPGEVFGACAGAALYRRNALVSVGGFDDRYFAYLEDVDLALRLRLQGWHCCYEPAVAFHAGEGSSHQLPGGHQRLVTRNTLVLVARAFPPRWLPYVAYRQLGWAWHALLERRLTAHLSGVVAAIPMLPAALRDRAALRRRSSVPIDVAVPPRPWRRRWGGGYMAGGEASLR